MWTAITAAVIMGGLVWVARIAAAALREHQRAEDVDDLAGACRTAVVTAEGAHLRLDRAQAETVGRLEALEGKVAAIQSAQALRPRR